MNDNRDYFDSLRVGVLLTLTGGFLDSYTYLCRGNVFANAQTGNMVMLGINLIKFNFGGILKYINPITAFFIGILVTEIIKGRLSEAEKIHWTQAIVLLEIILLILVGFITYDYIANIIVSLICAMQLEAFRKFHGNVYATTMCTGNLRSATEKLAMFLRSKEKIHLKIALQYYFIIFIFCLGAVLGGIITLNLGIKSVIFAIIPLIISLIILGYNRKRYKDI